MHWASINASIRRWHATAQCMNVCTRNPNTSIHSEWTTLFCTSSHAWCDVSLAVTHTWMETTHANTCGRYGSAKSWNTFEYAQRELNNLMASYPFSWQSKWLKLRHKRIQLWAERPIPQTISIFYYYYLLFIRKCAWQSNINIIHSFIAVRSWWHKIDVEHHIRMIGVDAVRRDTRPSDSIAELEENIFLHTNTMRARLDFYLSKIIFWCLFSFCSLISCLRHSLVFSCARLAQQIGYPYL